MRKVKHINSNSDLVIVGGGLAGICAAITAARGGTEVVLVQDRPVLGGNASSEIRLWALGATSHMGNNNRWSREGGVIDEILTENLYRNPEGNPVIFDTVLLDAVLAESHITVLLNTAVDGSKMKKNKPTMIDSVHAFNRQNETEYTISAPLFCDCSGDGTLGYITGAEYLMGKDDTSKKDALQYPESFGELLGSTIFFYTKDTKNPIRYIPPSFALKDISKLKRLHHITAKANGCDYWWIEWAGKLNTIHDSEKIKFSLWNIVYGVWNYIKNSGKFPQMENFTLEWVGCIPGKRESRRFIGDYTLTQADIVEQREFTDAVSYGGWAIDHHPSEGTHSQDYAACYQWHTKGIYSIPFRTLYSKDISNLFMGGRLISVSRVAFGSTRVMMTCAHTAQAIGAAAVICKHKNISPRHLAHNPKTIKVLQQYLLRDGQFIPHVKSIDTPLNKALNASIRATSEYKYLGFKPNGDWYKLEHSAALLFPAQAGIIPAFTVWIDTAVKCQLEVKIQKSKRTYNFTPEVLLEKITVPLDPSQKSYTICPSVPIEKEQFIFICFNKNTNIKIQRSLDLCTGITSVYNKFNNKVAHSAKQVPPVNSGIDSFNFWTPYRRPDAQNIALLSKKALTQFSASNICNGFHRPYLSANAWVASPNDNTPSIILSWNKIQKISTILLFFDTDFDFSMESVQIKHPESILPFCISHYKIYDDKNTLLYEKNNNHQARNKIMLSTISKSLRIEILATAGNVAPAIFGIQCW